MENLAVIAQRPVLHSVSNASTFARNRMRCQSKGTKYASINKQMRLASLKIPDYAFP